jgi:hypothetical protein
MRAHRAGLAEFRLFPRAWSRIRSTQRPSPGAWAARSNNPRRQIRPGPTVDNGLFPSLERTATFNINTASASSPWVKTKYCDQRRRWRGRLQDQTVLPFRFFLSPRVGRDLGLLAPNFLRLAPRRRRFRRLGRVFVQQYSRSRAQCPVSDKLSFPRGFFKAKRKILAGIILVDMLRS